LRQAQYFKNGGGGIKIPAVFFSAHSTVAYHLAAADKKPETF
jgi:hypothetical protein